MLSLNEIGLKYAFDFERGKNYSGGDKTSLGHNFTEYYDKLFSSIRTQNIKLLELGILCGKSLAMWNEYFENGSIYGIDINLKRYESTKSELQKLSPKPLNIKVFEQDITKDDSITLIEKLPSFDIIIDDAIHEVKWQYNNFINLFSKLNKGGLYIIEDIIDPILFVQCFGNIISCVSNPNFKLVKQLKEYSIANKIESFEIRQNMVIIKKKT